VALNTIREDLNNMMIGRGWRVILTLAETMQTEFNAKTPSGKDARG